MKREHLQQFITGKRRWTEPLAPEAKEKGFKHWYSSKHLPHFDAPGTHQFITFRLADAMPASRRSEWEAWLKLEDDMEKQRRIEAYLDKGYGECHLRDPRLAEMVQDNLWHHDGVKYRLLAWVIMPNHVHVLVEIWEIPLGRILHSWKSYTSKQAHKILRGGVGSSPHRSSDRERRGDKLSPPQTFWEDDYFDRYIRDEEHFRRVVRYIENNPTKAALARSPQAWPWSSARYRGESGPVVPVLTHPAARRVSPLSNTISGKR